MSIPILRIYPDYDIQKPTIPSRSRLYSLEPIGIGSCYVESLTSYLARLSLCHCVTPRQLFLSEIAPHLASLKNRIDWGSEIVTKVFGSQVCQPAANGTGKNAAYLLEALSILTLRNDLSNLTLLSWASVIPKRGLLRSQRAWCPLCYQQWQEADYERL